MNNIFFNAHHSPIGAFSSLTLGYKGKKGGLGLELGKPADQNFYVGLQREDEIFEALPFFEAAEDETARYDVEKTEIVPPLEIHETVESCVKIVPFQDHEITRTFKLSTDTFQAKDLTFTLYSQVTSIPDPETATAELMKAAIVPSVWLELTIDNTRSQKARRAFIGYTGTDPYSALVTVTVLK